MNRTILIVAPDHEARVGLRRVFEDAGHFVISATTGAEALMMLEKMTVPDIVFVSSDVVMMSGEHFLLAFHRYDQFAKVPAVQIQSQDVPQLPGVCSCISPPFDPESVLETLKHCF